MTTRILFFALIVLVGATPALAGFIDEQIFLSSSRTDEMRICDANTPPC